MAGPMGLGIWRSNTSGGAELHHTLEEGGQLLQLQRVTVKSAGIYQCNATNSIGSAYKEFNFTVMTPPTITGIDGVDRDTVNQIDIITGKDIILYCPVYGQPKPTITWLKEGQTIVHQPRFHRASSNELLLANAQVMDSGNYACLATNRAGTAEKQFNVQVIAPAKINLADEGEVGPGTAFLQEILVDMPFSVFCPALGSPQPLITWTKDGSPLEGLLGTGLDGRVELGDGGRRLRVLEALESDSGTYTCVAENLGGKDSAQYNITVLVPPLIIQDSETFHSITEGEEVTLKCEVEGDPPPATVWLFEGLDLQDLELPGVSIKNLEENMSIVEITRARETHSGMYTCIASSLAGSDELSYSVKVATPPRIADELASTHIVVRVKRPTTITCHVESMPKPQIFWFKNGNPVDADDDNVHLSNSGRELKILQVTENDAANYSCLALNEAGAISVNYTLE
ncbi:hypothetical protein SK128_000025, partial [Halocaridina rubra]